MECRSRFVVSEKFRQVVERLEPGKHQFSAVELVDEAGGHLEDYFWFNPCERIDSVDREQTTHELTETGAWRQLKGGRYVFNLSQIGDADMWIDPRLGSGTVFITENFKAMLSEADLPGLGYGELDAVGGN